jgi:hypothetical protein
MGRRMLLAVFFILALAAAGFAGGGTVTLPLEEYNALLKKAPVLKPTPVPPPLEYCLSKASYGLACRKDYTLLTMDVRLQIYRNQWMSIPLADGSFTVKSARLDGEEVSLVNSDGYLRLVTRQDGVHDLSVTFYLDSIFKNRQLTLPLMAATMSSLNMELIPPVAEVSLSSGLITALKQLPERTLVEAVLKPEQSLTITVREKPAAGAVQSGGGKRQKPRLFAEYYHLATMGEALMSIDTRLELSILNAPVTEVRLAVPRDLDILDANGASLGEWSVLEEKGGRYLRLSFKGPVQAQQSISISSEKKLKDVSATTAFPDFHLLDSDREKGYAGICARTNVEIKALKTERVVPIDVQELPSQLQSRGEHPILLAFKYLDSGFNLLLQVKRYEDVPVLTAVADSASAITLVTPEGKSVTKFQLTVRNNLKQFMSLALPAGSQLWSTFVASASVKPGRDEAGKIIIPLQKSSVAEGQVSSFPVEIVYFNPSGGLQFLGTSRYFLPGVDLPVTQVSWSFYLPENRRYWRFSGMEQVGYNPPPGERIPVVNNILRSRAQSQMAVKEENAPPPPAPLMEDKEIRQDMGQTLARGVLPVMVNIPEKGKVFHFQKLMVDRPPAVRVFYLSDWFYRLLEICFFLGALLLAHAWLNRKWKLSEVRRHKTSAALLAVLLILSFFYFRSFLWASLMGAICAWLYFAFSRWRERRMKPGPTA